MTNLKELKERFNLNTLNSFDANQLKGGRKAKVGFSDYSPPPPTKPVAGGGAGIPPKLDSSTFTFF